jgi:protein-S-isoprenylcysteine O-methyltransferase Ste14
MSTPIYVAVAGLVLAAAYVIFRVIVRRDYLGRGRLSPLSSLLEWVAILLWVAFASANQTPGWPAYSGSPMTRVIGWCLLIGGAASFAAALLFELGFRRSHGLHVDDLRQTGLYALTRNPQVVGFLVAMIGYLILWPSVRNAGSMALIAVITHLMVRTEEEHLRSRFGEQYDRYCERVQRYLGLGRRVRGSRG